MNMNDERSIAERMEMDRRERAAWIERALADFSVTGVYEGVLDIYLPSGDGGYEAAQRQTNTRHVYADIGELVARASIGSKLDGGGVVEVMVSVAHVADQDMPRWRLYRYTVKIWIA